jgi:hypothetical protein
MQRNFTSTLAGAPKQGQKLIAILIGGSILVLAVAVGIATWLSVSRHETSTSVTESNVVEVASTAMQPASASPLSSELTVYIVGSQAEAVSLMDTIRAGDRVLEQFGKPPFNAEVIVVTSAAEEEEILRANADAENIRAGMGLPPITVIDLREQ